MTHLQGFSIRSYIPVMETPPIDSKLVYELKVGSHCIFRYTSINISLVDIFLNAKCRRFKLQRILLLLLLAIATELVPSSHGQFFVGAPNGSPPVPRNVCQNATLNLNQSYDCPKIQSQTINCLINSKLIREKNQPSFSSLEFPLPHYTIWRIGGSC